MLKPRKIHPILIPLILSGIALAGCRRQSAPDHSAEVQRLTSELENTRLKLEAVEKALATKREDIALATATDEGKAPAAATQTSDVQKDAKIALLQTELDALKKRDAFAYAEASAAFRSGADIALSRYQQFIKNFPNSPLAADADRAITELAAVTDRETRARMTFADPRRAGRDALQHFSDGTVTVKEIAPLLRNRSAAEVVKLLGQPTQTYRDGKELGYVDKVIDTATGNKATLVIGFEADSVSTLRLGYLGKPIKP